MKSVIKIYFMKKSLIFCATLYFLISSCVSFKPGWKDNDKPKTGNKITIEQISLLESTANSSEKIQELINAYLEISKDDNYRYYGLWKAGNYHILMGAAYCEKKSEKKHHYKEAIKLCEKAMSTNTDFMNKINSGEDLTVASVALTINEIDAMGYWYTARFYYFKECLSPMGRIFNTKIVIENNKMIELIDILDPNWAGGGNYFSRGLYFIAVPERFGGSKTIAEEEFNKAVEVGPDIW